MGNKEIVVFSENIDHALELLAGARKIAEPLGARVVAVHIGDAEAAGTYFAYGADTVKVLPKFDDVPLEGRVRDIISVIGDSPCAILIGATNRGKSLAAYLSAELDTGCSTEIRGLDVVDGNIQVSRMMYGGLIVSTETCDAPYVMTASRMVFRTLEKDETRRGELIMCPCDESTYPVRITGIEPKNRDSVDLSVSKKIICVGRGVREEKDLSMVNELAELLSADTGCTRPIAKDSGWFSEDRFIGLSGKTVKPQLYLVIGSSGQIQHLAGAVDSKIIMAINNDPVAPAYLYSDYGVVGDLYQIVPAMIEQIKMLR